MCACFFCLFFFDSVSGDLDLAFYILFIVLFHALGICSVSLSLLRCFNCCSEHFTCAYSQSPGAWYLERQEKPL